MQFATDAFFDFKLRAPIVICQRLDRVARLVALDLRGIRWARANDAHLTTKHVDDLREFVETLWQKYCRYADPQFRREIRTSFNERFWEMSLTCALLDCGLDVSCPKPGPDNLVTHQGIKVWIEAICPGPGAPGMPDSVPRWCVSEKCLYVLWRKTTLCARHCLRFTWLRC